MKIQKRTQSTRGFTLVEIIVVIVIIATLSAISFAAFNVLVRRSNDKAVAGGISLIEAKLTRYLSDPAESLPAGDGSDKSSNELYVILTGDTTNNGESNVTDGSEALWPELLADALNEKKDGTGKLVKLVGTEMQLVDPYGIPLRYFHDSATRKGKKNLYDNGYDIWAAGEDGITKDDPATVPSGSNGMLDDVTNWSK